MKVFSKNLVSLLLIVGGSISFIGCGNKSGYTNYTVHNNKVTSTPYTSSVEVATQGAVSGVAVSPEAIIPKLEGVVSGSAVKNVVTKLKKVKYTDKYKKQVDKVLDSCTYIKLKQVLSTRKFNDDKTEGATENNEDFMIEYDLKNKILNADFTVSYSASLGSGNFKVRNDYKNKVFYIKRNDKKWEKSEKEGTSLTGIDVKKVKTTKEVFHVLVDDYLPKEGVVGVKDGSNDIFTTIRKATKSDVTGGTYDKLLVTKYIYTVDSKKKLPVSIVKSVSFILNEEEYTIRTVVSIDEISKKSIKPFKVGK